MIFLSTLSLRRATQFGRAFWPGLSLFLSTLSLRRATTQPGKSHKLTEHFYPRSPCGERRESQPPCARPTTDFYPRSPCGERPPKRQETHQSQVISIHALLAESDNQRFETQMGEFLFLSTLSLRRATAQTARNTSIAGHFYPRSPCGERQRT